MIFIKHRVNSIKELKETPHNFGVEVDLRTLDEKIILNHDPFLRGDEFEEWLKNYNHNFLVLNIKDVGIESNILNLMYKYSIQNFFFLDLPFPSLFNLSKLTRNISSRFSIYEDIQSTLNISNRISWVWVDFYNKSPLSYSNWKMLVSNNIKICIASPELHGLDPLIEIQKLKLFLNEEKVTFDAVCSKYPEYWNDE